MKLSIIVHVIGDPTDDWMYLIPFLFDIKKMHYSKSRNSRTTGASWLKNNRVIISSSNSVEISHSAVLKSFHSAVFSLPMIILTWKECHFIHFTWSVLFESIALCEDSMWLKYNGATIWARFLRHHFFQWIIIAPIKF